MNTKKTVTVATYVTTSTKEATRSTKPAKKNTAKNSIASERRENPPIKKPLEIDKDQIPQIERWADRIGMNVNFALEELLHFALANHTSFPSFK